MSKVLVADQNVLFRRGLRVLLAKEPEFTLMDDASNASEALSKVRSDSPDVLVISMDLLDSGSQMGSCLRNAKPDLAILVLTQIDIPENLKKSVDAGAKGYMLKQSPPAQILNGIRQLVRSTGNDPAEVSGAVPDLRALAEQTPRQDRTSPLTSREQEVVRLLAEGRTVRAVAQELSLSIKTVEAHKLNLMRKLNIHNRSSLVKYAMREGMVEA